MLRLLGLAQGRLSRGELAQWCRGQAFLPVGARVLAAYLAEPKPETARALAHSAGEITLWLAGAPGELMQLVALVWFEAAQLLQGRGQGAEAEAMLELMAKLAPGLLDTWLLLVRFQAVNRGTDAALATLDRALGLFPGHPGLHSLQAQLLLQSGRGAQALALFEELSHTQPELTEIWLGLGNLRQSLGDLGGAQSAYARGLELAPAHPGLWNNLGQVLQRLLQPEQAEAAYQRALRLEPQLVEAWNNLATLELDRGHLPAARMAIEKVLQLAPGYAQAWINAGIAAGLADSGEQARQAFARARALNPLLSEAWVEEISLLLKLRQRQQALDLVQTALQQLPQSADLQWYHSRLLAALNRPAEAQIAGERALQMAPGHGFRRLQLQLGWVENLFLAPEVQQRAWCERTEYNLIHWPGPRFGLSELLPEMRYLPELLGNLAYIGDWPHTRLNAALAQLIAIDPGRAEGSGTKGPLRLGAMVSHQHEGLFLSCNSALPLLRRLSQDFQLVLIGDPTRLGPQLPPGAELIPLPGHLPAAVEAIRAAKLDLLYYWEVGSDSLNYFLPFFRLAPVQFTGWGTQNSPGIPALDYFFSSALNEPDGAQAHYSERLLLQPDLPVYCQPQSAEPASREQLGLPEGILYVCLQHPQKYCLGFITALAGILGRDPDARLILLASPQPWIQQRVEQALAAVVEPAQLTRVKWLQVPIPYPRFLRLFELADVVLDTRTYSGGQTSDDALLMGTPIVSYPGEAWRTRQTLGRLQLLNLNPCIASSWEDYSTKAIAIAHPGPLREQVRATLAAELWRLRENPAGAEHFAELLKQAAKEKGIIN
ncbi:MAG: tetratricopeptide repeat protein [Candidatus Sericytochromatia bacterium]